MDFSDVDPFESPKARRENGCIVCSQALSESFPPELNCLAPMRIKIFFHIFLKHRCRVATHHSGIHGVQPPVHGRYIDP